MLTAKGTIGDKKYYAKWEIENYTVSYELNSGVQGDNVIDSYNIESDTINMIGDFPEPGECPINAITIVDWQNYTVYTLLLRNQSNPLIEQFENEDRDKQIEELKSIMQDTVGGEAQFKKNGLNNLDFKLLFFDEEIQLIYGLFDIINIKKPDFVLAWNMAFDIPYIIARIKNLGYDPTDIMCNPDFEDKQCKYVVDDKDMKGETKVFAERGDYAVISSYSEFIDQMIQFASRRKGQSRFISFTLDFIGEAVAKVRKLDYKHIHYKEVGIPCDSRQRIALYQLDNSGCYHVFC